MLFMMSKHKIFSTLFMAAAFLSALMVSTSPLRAESDPFYTGYLSNVAVQGYDPVAYFKEGTPVKGRSDFSTEYKGAEFHFSTQANLDTFKTEPDKYAPQFGGYCAWAVAQGYTAKGDANHWAVVDGKLYLNYNADIKARWQADIPGFIERANQNWTAVLK